MLWTLSLLGSAALRYRDQVAQMSFGDHTEEVRQAAEDCLLELLVETDPQRLNSSYSHDAEDEASELSFSEALGAYSGCHHLVAAL